MRKQLQISNASMLPFMLAVVLLLGLGNLLFGELVPAGEGFGWDGVTYADMVRRLGAMIADGQLSRYYSQRILPSLVVRTGLSISGADLSNRNIILGFELLNLTALAIGVIVWKRMTDLLSIGPEGQWIGFAGLFLNYFGTKHLAYAPVTTDGLALLVSLIMLWLYLEGRQVGLLIATIAGSFIWQLTGLYGAILLVFLNQKLPSAETVEVPTIVGARSDRQTIRMFCSFAALAALAIAAIILYVLPGALTDGSVKHQAAIFLTGVPSLLLVVLALWMLAGPVLMNRTPSVLLAHVRLRHVVLAVLGLLIPQIAFTTLSNPDVPNPSGALYVMKLIAFPMAGRGKFLMPFLAATLLWGPAVLVVMLRWRAVASALRGLGLGPAGVVAATLPLILVTESRFILGAWPSLVLALAIVLDKSGTSHYFKHVFAVLTLLNTQLWLRFNVGPWQGNDYADLFDFPKQMFFLHYGPWMGWPAYLVQLPLVLLAGCLLWVTMRGNPSRFAGH